MENEKYLSEERYQRNNTKVKKVGKILLIIGVITLVVSFIILALGFLGFGGTFINGVNNSPEAGQIAKGVIGGIGLFALGGIINSIGFLLTVSGGMILFIAHRREITAYTTQQVMPIAKEEIEKITPTVANAAGSIAESISKGIENGKNNK